MRLLHQYQGLVDARPTYPEQVEEGKRLFKLRNVPSNSAFREVRRLLNEMCKGPNRCMYCEDSSADQIDHFYPKDFFPRRVFQ